LIGVGEANHQAINSCKKEKEEKEEIIIMVSLTFKYSYIDQFST